MAASSSSNGTGDGTTKEEPTRKQRPIPRNALPCTSDNIAHVELFRPKTITNNNATVTAANSGATGKNKKKRRGPPLKKYHLLFGMLYLCQAYWIYSTVGVPYKEFLDKAEREGFEGECLLYLLLVVICMVVVICDSDTIDRCHWH